jgi:aerobic carbon-monoxide dehydrogenase medium subunit
LIPATFDYARPSSAEEAVSLLGQRGPDARLLAGGHSLIPLMKRRLAVPGLLIDVGHIDELRYISRGRSQLRIGALTRHADLEHDPLLAAEVPVLRQAASTIGDPQVRRRGTIGGSVAHADPVADLPVTLLALDADVVVRGASGERVIPMGKFLDGTGPGPADMITEIRVPLAHCGRGYFEKFSRRTCGWAVVSAAAVTGATGTRVAISGLGSRPVRATATERALAGGASAREAADMAAAGCDPAGDDHAGPGFRRHLAKVLTCRALKQVHRDDGSENS